jgi:multidrug efflux pump subunit AcrA (membrane-fusion protein)
VSSAARAPSSTAPRPPPSSRSPPCQKAEIVLAAGGKLTGTVISRARALDPATGLGTVRLRIEAAHPESEPEAAAPGGERKRADKDADKKDDKDDKDEAPAGPPPIGAFARATIVVGKREGVLMLPASALRGAAADGAEIVICKGDKVEIRAVEVGYREASGKAPRVEIAEGLKPGEKVAVDHVLGLDEESKIVETKGEPAEEKDEKKEGDKKDGDKKDEKK